MNCLFKFIEQTYKERTLVTSICNILNWHTFKKNSNSWLLVMKYTLLLSFLRHFRQPRRWWSSTDGPSSSWAPDKQLLELNTSIKPVCLLYEGTLIFNSAGMMTGEVTATGKRIAVSPDSEGVSALVNKQLITITRARNTEATGYYFRETLQTNVLS